ncbi:hypothetical protein ABW19_dt0207641 [Dactylella cylindrospora]|nr:hypothetical protein ABW19_dt0207641 [Dactylella cylindrospora]
MSLESLDRTEWDVVITGTGLRESLLAAALARAGKKVLHIDKNPYYGDEYAALSLEELETWAKNAEPDRLQAVEFKIHESTGGPKLAKSRAYTVNLSPGLLFTTSPILSLLVKSGLHESLEFVKVGSWFVYDGADGNGLIPVPTSREDVFNDTSLDARTKRIVVRALKSIMGLEGTTAAANQSTTGKSLKEHLEQPPLSLPPSIVAAFTSLTLSQDPPSSIPFEVAEQNIRKYFGSIGRFGPGFAAVIGRYGSGSEIIQILCRAAAVTGNAVYVLENHINEIRPDVRRPSAKGRGQSGERQAETEGYEVTLQTGDKVWTRHLVGKSYSLPVTSTPSQPAASSDSNLCWHSIYVVSAPLERLFKTNDPPIAAGAVVYMPAGSLSDGNNSNQNPIFVVGHSSETEECPGGQNLAAKALLEKLPNEDGFVGQILLSLKFQGPSETPTLSEGDCSNGVHRLPGHAPGVEIPDEIVTSTMDLYEAIAGSRDDFMEKVEADYPGRLE